MIAKKNESKDGNHEPLVRDFLKKYKLDLIQIPEEFSNVEPDENTKKGRKALSRKKILSRSSKSLVDYHVWRSHDRQIIQADGKD